MSAPRSHAQRIHAVIALSAGLTLLVASALGWLGWKVISQERALDRQRQRERLEQTADAVAARVPKSAGSGKGARPRSRRQRLRDEAVQSERTARPNPCGASWPCDAGAGGD